MYRFFKIILFSILVLTIAYQNSQTVRTRLEPVVGPVVRPAYGKISELIRYIAPDIIFKPAACVEPIKYSLGEFDTQFGIPKTYFLGALRDAESMWEKTIDKDLFVYTPEDSDKKDTLKVNLVYDYRQQATSRLKNLGLDVKNSQASYDSLRAKYLKIQGDYLRIKSLYDEQVRNFNADNAAYEQKVEYWNQRGGAPDKEYEELTAEKRSLENRALDLKTTLMQLNSMVDEINALVVVLNQLANTLNLSVEEYNAIGAARGESFEEGLYEVNSTGKKIDIYEFSDREKLVRVLAHELGHALGLSHVSDPQAIMYSYNTGTSTALTTADIVAVKTVCKVK